MERRGRKRFPANLEVQFFHDREIHYGVVTDISDKGMCIKVGVSLPYNSGDRLLMYLKNEPLRIPYKILWLKKSCNMSDAIGVEVLQLYERHLELVTLVSQN
ncbi:MAG: hypothetical protein AMK70_02330 [Nitrospira bacterium SG8_35_1]|nr:MAG: hypothetical protein AMK70_02330 [Nitrospira bacterium SG8_35_1]